MTTVVTFTFDDGWANFMDSAAYLEQRQFRGTYFIQTNAAAADIGWANLRNLEGRGHEIGGHTVTHAMLTTETVGRRNATFWEIDECRRVILGNGINICNTFAYTFYVYNAEVALMCEDAGYIAARAGGGGTDTLPPLDGNNFMTRSWCLGREQQRLGGNAVGGLNGAMYQRMVQVTQAAIERDSVDLRDQWVCHTLHLVVPNWTNANEVSRAAFEQYLDWLRSRIDSGVDLTVKTYRDAIAPYAHWHGTRYTTIRPFVQNQSWGAINADPNAGAFPSVVLPLSSYTGAGTIGVEFDVSEPGLLLTAYMWAMHGDARQQAPRTMQFALYEVRGPDVGRLVPGSEIPFGEMLWGVTDMAMPYFWQRVPVNVPLVEGRRYRACAFNPGGGGPWFTEMPGNESFRAGVDFERGNQFSGNFTRGVPARIWRDFLAVGGNSTWNGGTTMAYPSAGINGASRGLDVEISRPGQQAQPAYQPISTAALRTDVQYNDFGGIVEPVRRTVRRRK